MAQIKDAASELDPIILQRVLNPTASTFRKHVDQVTKELVQARTKIQNTRVMTLMNTKPKPAYRCQNCQKQYTSSLKLSRHLTVCDQRYPNSQPLLSELYFQSCQQVEQQKKAEKQEIPVSQPRKRKMKIRPILIKIEDSPKTDKQEHKQEYKLNDQQKEVEQMQSLQIENYEEQIRKIIEGKILLRECPVCFKKYIQDKSVRRHLWKVHKINILKMNEKQFKEKAIQIFQCKDCEFSCFSQNTLVQHSRNCVGSIRNIFQEKSIDFDIYIDGSEFKHYCQICDLYFDSVNAYRDHEKKHSQPRMSTRQSSMKNPQKAYPRNNRQSKSE